MSEPTAGRDALHPQDERGVALAMALIVLAVLSTLAALLLALAHYETASAADTRLAIQCEALAESGWNLAFREMAGTRFDGSSTHLLDAEGRLVPNTEQPLIPAIASPLSGEVVAVIDDEGDDEGLLRNLDDGAYVWSWAPGDAHGELSGAGVPEELRIKVYYNDENRLSFSILVEATLTTPTNPVTRKLLVSGRTQPLEQYVLFSAADLALAGEADRLVDGAVHANGDVFLQPENALVRLAGERLTAGGRLLRLRDAWDRENLAGEVIVELTDEEGEPEDILWFTEPPFDSEHLEEAEGYAFYDNDPTNNIIGCQELFRGTIRDGYMGTGGFQAPYLADAAWLRARADLAFVRDGAVISCFDPEGVYQAAPLEAADYVPFVNPATGYSGELIELDLARLADPNGDGVDDDSLWPASGILFIEGDCRLRGLRSLPSELVVLTDGSLYTVGDVNVEAPRHLSLVAPLGRVWHLSENWDDAAVVQPFSARPAADTRVIAVIADGAPLIEEQNYVGGDGTAPAAALHLLEDWTGRLLRLEGCRLHLRTASMAPLGEPPREGELAWLTAEAYAPPRLELVYDRRLETERGPFPLTGARIIAWQRLSD